MRRGLPYELFLGLRYLGSRGKRTNLSLFVWIGVGGVFLGVAALIIVLAVMTGFQDGIRDRILSANPHLLIFQSGGSGMAEAGPGGLARARRAGCASRHAVRPAAGALHQSGWRGPRRAGARRGRAPIATVMADLQRQLRSGRLEGFADGEGAMLLGAELARLLGVLPGDFVTVISPKGALTAVGMVPKMRRYVVAGTIEAGMHEFDSSIAYLPLAAARDFSGLPGVTGVEVKLADPFQARAIGRTIAGRLGFPYWVRDWMEMNRNLFAALQLEKLALFVVVTIIVLVAAFAIIGHLVLLVAEKRKEIGILKSIGATASSITTVFFTVGMTIGAVGTLAGCLVGLTVIWVQNTYKIIRLAGDVYQINYLPMKLTATDFIMIVGATLVLSFFATIIPARRAGSLQPVDVLRYE